MPYEPCKDAKQAAIDAYDAWEELWWVAMEALAAYFLAVAAASAACGALHPLYCPSGIATCYLIYQDAWRKIEDANELAEIGIEAQQVYYRCIIDHKKAEAHAEELGEIEMIEEPDPGLIPEAPC